MAENKPLLPSSGVATQQQTQQPQPRRKGTGFTNLSRILQASQGSKLGQTIAGGISGQAQQVQSGIQSAQEQFKKEAEANRVGTAQDEANRRAIIETASSGGDVSSNIGTFKNYLSGEYKGPMELANQAQLATQAQQAQTLGELASGIGSKSRTGEGGRQELLRRFAGGADYTSGQRKLDESILAKDSGTNLASVARQTKGVAEEAQRAGALAQSKAQEYQKLAGIFAADTKQKLKEATEPISTELDKRVIEARNKEEKRTKFLQDLQTEMSTNEYKDLTDAQKTEKLKSVLSQLGPGNLGVMTQEDIDNLIGEKGFLSSINADMERQNQIKSFMRKQYGGNEFWGFAPTGENLTQYQKNYENKLKNIPDLLLQSFVPGVAGSDISAQNINRQGLVDSATLAKLNALSSLKGEGPEFLSQQQQYTPGSVSNLGSLPTRKATTETKISNTEDMIKILEDRLSQKDADKIRNEYMPFLKQQQKYLSEYKSELQALKDIEDAQLKK